MSVIQFLESTRAELKHVKWPSRRQTILLTVVVIVASLAVGYMLGGFDWLFKQVLRSTII